eukprot:384659-Pyramimonas_sp.AAC.1
MEFSMTLQTFTTTVADDEGNILFVGDDVSFRAVTREQILKAMESQMPEDAQKLYQVGWTDVPARKDQAEEEDE